MQGPFTLVPPGANEAAIAAAGLGLSSMFDTTGSVAKIARGLRVARWTSDQGTADDRGLEWYSDRQQYLAATETLAATGRLSRYFYVAEKLSN